MKEKINALKKSRLVVAVAAMLLLLATVAIIVLGRGGTSPASAAPDEADGTPMSDALEGSSGGGGLAAYDKNGDGVVYQDGMHPWYVQDEPGIAPDCGMALTPVRVDGTQEEGTVKIDPVTIQNIGVRTAPVVVEALARTVRATGRFEANERGLAAVSPKVGGWVEKLHVEYVGARVRRGQPLLEIYSPELVSTQEEYLLALRSAERLGGGSASSDGQRLVEAARRRLSYWDISEAQIRELERTGKPQKTLTLYAPASGTVTTKDVVEGQQIMPGQTLMELADLSRLWLMVDVYEQDLAWVSVGTLARIELPYDPGKVLTGRVDYIYDDLDPETRTVKARVTLSNPDLQLKPGMYATVYLTGSETQSFPTVPSEALLRTGEQEVVILALGEGRFRPQKVVAGVQSDGKVQILEGLQGGEEVVTSAQFLIDSEARLQSAIGAMMSMPDMNPTGDPNTRATDSASMQGMSMGEHGGMASGQDGSAATHPQAKDGVQVVQVAVGASGFEPMKIELEAGTPARLVFTRTTDATCAKQVQVPAFNIKTTDLPLNKPVTIEFTPRKDGTFTFACGMDMLKGTLVVTS